jgi:hypothetical protein
METIEDLKAALEAKETELNTTKEALATAEATNTSTVDEIKTLRQKKQEAEAERDLALAKANKDGHADVPDISTVIQKELDAREAKDAEKIKVDALESFKMAHKELFADANDVGGLKFSAFKDSLSKLNLSGLKTATQFSEAYENALILMNRGKTQSQPNRNGEGAIIPPTGGGSPKVDEDSGLEYKETELIRSLGWTEERYLKQKKARPAYVAALLASIQ